MSETSLPELSVDARKMAERSLEQVKNSIDTYFQFIQRGVPANVVGGSELGNRVFDYAKNNVATAFEFAQKLVQVKDFQDLAKVQTEFIHAQMHAMAEQSRGLSETAAQVLMESTKLLTKRNS